MGIYLLLRLSNDQRQRHYKRGMHAYEGYGIGFELAGWCIFCDKSLWDKIGPLDESHNFWFSDNMYAKQLKAKGIKHALICNVKVDHMGSKNASATATFTTKIFNRICQKSEQIRSYREYTGGSMRIFQCSFT